MDRAWDWRKAVGGCTPSSNHRDGVRYFHAHDVNDNAACETSLGLRASCEPVNEGSALCPDCIEVVQAQPAGRDRRVFQPGGPTDA
jgi:hypothetical protein